MTTPNTNHSTVSFTDLSEARAYATTQTFTEQTFLIRMFPNDHGYRNRFVFMTGDKMTEDGYVFLPSGNLWSATGEQGGTIIQIIKHYLPLN